MTKIKDSKIDFLQPDIYTGIIKPNDFTTVEMNAIENPVEGWLLNNSDYDSLMRYDGTEWKAIDATTPPSQSSVVYDAYVGPGQDYINLTEALADNKTKIAVVGDVTSEPSEPTFTGGYYNVLIDFFANWTSAFSINFGGATQCTLRGNTGMVLTFNKTVSEACIKTVANANLFIHDLTIVNDGVVNCPFPYSDEKTSVSSNIIYYHHNNGGQYTINGPFSKGNNLLITSSEIDSGTMLSIYNNAVVTNATIEGQIDITWPFLQVLTGSILDGALISTTGFNTQNIEVGGTLSNVVMISDQQPDPADINITVVDDYVSITNVINQSGGLFAVDCINSTFTNLRGFLSDFAELTLINGSNNIFNGFETTQFLSVTGINNSFINCIIREGAELGDTGIHLQASTSKCIVALCITKIATTDSGTGNVVANNIVTG